jgi:hypothetical protein
VIDIIAIVALIVIFIYISGTFKKNKSVSILEQAMEQENLELVEKKYELLEGGPFSGDVSFKQSIFRIKVKDENGKVGSGWACVGSYFLSVYTTRKVKIYLPTFYKDAYKVIDLNKD